jgi:mutator protein MutT
LITVTAAIIQKNDLILTAKRKEGLHLAGYWEFPGGKLEDGEQPEECLRRELYEEFGIESEIGACIGESVFHYESKTIRLLGFLTTHISGEFSLTDHDEIRWLKPEELKALRWAPADVPLVDELIASRITDKNLSYYEANAKEYINETINLDIEDIRNKFISMLPSKAHILDLGCGSGRDSRVFLDLGYSVTAIDPSHAIASITSKFLGQAVQIQKAQDIKEVGQYDAIWACASLLHVPKTDIPVVISKLVNALRPGGIMYISFKQGNAERWDNRGRFFNDYSPEKMLQLIEQIEEIQQLDITTNDSVLRGQTQTWLNIFARKTVR